MIFATPLGLLALAAVPAIIAIHLFRRRFPVRPIAGLFLWQIARERPEGGGKITTLPVTTSLILECLAALALALILAGARCASTNVSQHLVVLLDDSLSMTAVNSRGESARDRAVRRVVSEIERLGSRGRITLVRSGERPSVFAGPALVATEARAAIEAWTPQAPDHSFALGLRLARELAGETGTLMVLSDGTPASRGDREVEGALWVAVGERLANVGITGAQRTLTPDEGRGAIALTLGNFSNAPVRRRLSIDAGGKPVLVRDIDVPEGTSSITLPLPTGVSAARVSLSDDALRKDNEVVLVEPSPQIVGVENRLGDGRGRQALVKALAAVAGVTSAEPGQLAFVDAAGLDGDAPAGTWRVGFGPAPPGWRASGESQDFVGPFVLEKRHPLLAGVTLGGVVWPGAVPTRPDALRPVASAGDRLLVGLRISAASGPDPAVLFNLDLERTNLIRAPDWPILISNLVEMRRRELPGPERWNYRAGEWIRVRLGRDPKGPLRVRMGTFERELPPGRLLEFVAPAPGGLLQITERDERLYELAVNVLDEAEGDLRDRSAAEIGELNPQAPGLDAESGLASDPLFWILLAIGGAALVANWCLPGVRSLA